MNIHSAGRLASMLLLPALLHAQGFGGMAGLKKTKEVSLKRMLPAAVNLNQKRIKVTAIAASGKTNDDLLTILRTKLVTLIQKDSRFIVDDKNPETLLKFTVTNSYVESRTMAAAGNVPACTFFTGKIETSYQAIDVSTNAPLDSQNLEFAITQQDPKKSGVLSAVPGLKRASSGCGTNAKGTQNEARDALVDGIVAQMAQRAAPFEETLTVPVPEGKLEPLSALARSQRWAKLLEDAEKMDPLSKPEDDAYRKYLVGLANEALAYQDTKDASDLETARAGDTRSEKAKQSIAQEAKDFDEAQRYLDKAAKAYKDALQAKAGEKEFREPDARMEEAVKLYATIDRHKQEYQEAVLKKRGGSATATTVATRSTGTGAAAPASTQVSAVNRVITMCQDRTSGIDQLIRDHPTELHFDKGLSLDEELKVRKECGADSAKILDEIKKQISARAAAPAKAAVPAKK